MSDSPSQNQINEMWKNLIRESAEDDIDREIIAMAERQEATQSSKRKSFHRRYIDRERERGHDRLVREYIVDEPIFGANLFWRRFRMCRELFLHIVEALSAHSFYFKLREDATGRNGLSPLQKCITVIRQLAYTVPGDSLDEYMRMGESTALECRNKFYTCVVEVFAPKYLRSPNKTDTECVLHMHEERHGFPGMLGSLDCMHWAWRNCPVAWKGQHTQGDHGVPTVVLEAVASADLWIWHAFFGVAGSSNDINVLHGSPLFNSVLQRNVPQVQFIVNGTKYNRGYYLTDGIYPE